jgi:hypothetical protein
MSPAKERPGGYRRALDRVFRPILCTFSQHDAPLHRFFHLILRRDKDLGEMKIAAAGEPPSRFAALGGYGPRGSGERLITVLDATAIDCGRALRSEQPDPDHRHRRHAYDRRARRFQQPIDLLDAVQPGDGVSKEGKTRRRGDFTIHN